MKLNVYAFKVIDIQWIENNPYAIYFKLSTYLKV
jgi:hypothetical protein